MNSVSDIVLQGKRIIVHILPTFEMKVTDRRGLPLWSTSSINLPTLTVKEQSLPLHLANRRSMMPFRLDGYLGHTLKVSGFAETDIVIELIFALDPARDELFIQIEQTGGQDSVRRIDHLYRLEKSVSAGGYLVIPHGSGYLIPADCPDELPGTFTENNFIGARWTLPFFGLVAGKEALCVTADSWWDCEVAAYHVPGRHSALDFTWQSSLGRLRYPRRQRIRFGRDMDYVTMAKEYRQEARRQGLVRTLEEKTAQTPVIRSYAQNILFRWPAWNVRDSQQVLTDIRRVQALGLGINFFFPKWSSAGYSPDRNTATTADGNWQSFLQETPIPGGWPVLADFARQLHDAGCTIQGFICPRTQYPHGPKFDPSRRPLNEKGEPVEDLSVHDALDRMNKVLDFIQGKGLTLDVMYYDGYAAFDNLPEDFTLTRPITRRQTFETQNHIFAETRRRGIMPGGEVARFWCMAECDYFFFTDWARDRLTNTPTKGSPGPVGKPIPLFQLVFHDCYIAGFSGGGYALYTPGYDWWPDRNPRLYELLFASAPAHNWLPNGYVPVKDWNSPRWEWLKCWSAWYRAIAGSEMVRHEFCSGDDHRQRVEFANGAAGEFDLTQNRFRLIGVPDLSENWEYANY